MQITTSSGSASAPLMKGFSVIALAASALVSVLLISAFWYVSLSDIQRDVEERADLASAQIEKLDSPSAESLSLISQTLSLSMIELHGRDGSVILVGSPSAAGERFSFPSAVGDVVVSVDRSAADAKLSRRLIYAGGVALFLETALLFGFLALARRGEREVARREKENKEMESELFFLAHYDPVTSLPNRTLFWERLDASVERARRLGKGLALVAIHLPSCGEVGREYGRSVGDAALLESSSRIQHACRKEDLVCRVGPDAFVVLLEDLPIEQISSAVQRFSDKIAVASRQLWTVPDSDSVLYLTLHLGVSSFPADGASSEALLKIAEDRASEIKFAA